MSKRATVPALLTVVAVLLVLNLVVALTGAGPASAMAQTERTPPGELFNSGEQRKRMIEQLSQINERLGRIESRMEKGFNVKVTDLPPVKIAGGLPEPESK